MPIETTKDFLLVVLAICIIFLTFFVSWLLYSIITILRDAESVVHQIRGAVEKVDALCHTVRDKVEHSAATMALVGQALREVVVWAIEEKKKKARPAGSRRKSAPVNEEE